MDEKGFAVDTPRRTAALRIILKGFEWVEERERKNAVHGSLGQLSVMYHRREMRRLGGTRNCRQGWTVCLGSCSVGSQQTLLSSDPYEEEIQLLNSAYSLTDMSPWVWNASEFHISWHRHYAYTNRCWLTSPLPCRLIFQPTVCDHCTHYSSMSCVG